MRGKVCVITGTTSGIGAVIAAALAKKGATVFMLNRDKRLSERTGRDISVYAVNTAVHTVACDLESREAVAAAIATIRDATERVDVIINNASAFYPTPKVGKDGVELTLRTNYLSHYELTTGLLDRLRAADQGRVVSVVGPPSFSSGLVPQNGRATEVGYAAFEASRNRLLLFTLELARRMAGTNVTANAVYPGRIKTEVFAGAPLMSKIATRLAGQSVSQAAEIVTELATDAHYEKTTGTLLLPAGPATLRPELTDPAIGKALWDWTASALGTPAR